MTKLREDLTYEEASEFLNYNPLTGILVWKVGRGGVRVGSIAGCVWTDSKDSMTYRHVRIKGFNYRAHRVAFLLQTGKWPRDQIDHLNHDGLDNRWENLREATNAENGKNQRRYSTNTSGATGVDWHKARKKWRAQIQVNGISKHLGYFTEKEDAITARKAAEVEYGFHENHGKKK